VEKSSMKNLLRPFSILVLTIQKRVTWFVMLEKISDSNVCSRRLRREQTWSNAQLGVRAAAGGANVSHHRQGKA